MTTKDAAPVGPSFVYTQPDPDWNRRRRQRLAERRVTVTNPDGSTTEHTFWTDTHLHPHLR